MKTALVYDWFTEKTGGGEKAFEAIYSLYPSPIFTLLRDPERTKATPFHNQVIHTSFIQKFPKALKLYRHYLPFFPLAIEQFDLSSYDLILSCSSCVAKGVLTHAEQIHLCYCLTPVRFAWDLYHQYLHESGLNRGWKGALAKFFLHYIRLWDLQSAPRVDAFAAISHYVARRIEKTYGKKATVIYPPVNTDFYQLEEKKEEFYVTASRFVPYKRMDLIVEAFAKTPHRKLVVIGDGPDFKKVKKKATPNVSLLGYQSNEVLRSHLQRAKAFLFAAVEDFGIVPLEAQSCGTPVIAFGKGASLETVRSNETGLFFYEQTPEALSQAIDRFEQMTFTPTTIRAWAETFNLRRFAEEYKSWVERECMRIQLGEKQCTS